MKTTALLFLLALLFTSVEHEFINYSIDDEFTLKITGSSNIHDWVSTVNEISGIVEVSPIDENGGFKVEQCDLIFPVESIQSSKGSIMDRKTRAALKADEFPNIEYQLINFSELVQNGNNFRAIATGVLKIAGTSKTISMSISGTKSSNGNLTIIGSKALKMTSFNIDPPKALMGALTTSDDINVEFQINLVQN